MNSTIIEAALWLGEQVELSILGKATVLLAAGLLAAHFAARARASVRHLLLAATMGSLIALPLVAAVAPALTLEIPVARQSISTPDRQEVAPVTAGSTPVTAGSAQAIAALAATPSSRAFISSWADTLRLGWGVVALALIVSLAVGVSRLLRMRRAGLPWIERRALVQGLARESGIKRQVDLLLSEEISAPLTCGLRRPAIMLPMDAREWSEADLRRALLHELEHVRRGDWALQLAVRVTCALYWFHPLVWMAARRLELEAERACDDAVAQTEERTEYAEQLVSLAERLARARHVTALGMANRSDLAARVEALLDGEQRRGRAGMLAAVSAMVVAAIAVFALAPARAIAQSGRLLAASAISDAEPAASLGGRESAGASGAQTAAARRGPAQENEQEDERRERRQRGVLDEALYEAAESGDVAAIERLLNAGANVNCALDGDGSPLIGAARSGHLAAVRLLLDRGADPNLAVPGDGNPLIMAAREGHEAVVALLLDRGASIDQVVPEDENALIQASGGGHLGVVKLLVERGADVNARAWAATSFGRPNGEWRTPLGMARRGRHEAVIAYLIAAGARE